MSKLKAKAKSTPTKRAVKRTTKPKTRRAPEPAGRPASGPLLGVERRARSDDADAFIPDPSEGPARTRDALAEVLAEDFVESATRGNDVLEDDFERVLSDEVGGPFVLTDADTELADDLDASNPADAEAEPLPRAIAGLIQRPGRELEDQDEDEEDDGDEETGDDEVRADLDRPR
jgi:hypothetical protein